MVIRRLFAPVNQAKRPRQPRRALDIAPLGKAFDEGIAAPDTLYPDWPTGQFAAITGQQGGAA